MNKFLKIIFSVFSVTTLMLFSAFPASAKDDVSSEWDTSRGTLNLRQSGSKVEGKYTHDNGEVYGNISGDVFTGYWVEDDAFERCSTARRGRYHWGKFRMVFSGDKFRAQWDHCDRDLKTSYQLHWIGTKVSGEINEDVNQAPPVNVQGEWKTNWERLYIEQSGNKVKGTYPSNDNGEIIGTMNGDVLKGIWIEDGSQKKCSTARNGRYYWGKFRMVFEGDKFKAVWDYCDRSLENNYKFNWTGTKIPDEEATMADNENVAPVDIEGLWDTNWTDLSLEKRGNKVTGKYPDNDNGEVFGEFSNNVFTGFWIEDMSNEMCSTPLKNRYYWGKFRMKFKGDTFHASWGYCEDGELSRSWTGKKISNFNPKNVYKNPKNTGDSADPKAEEIQEDTTETTQCNSEEPKGHATITSPRDGSEVSYHEDVSGTFSSINPEAEIWLANFSTLTDRYWFWPAKKYGETSGTWTVTEVGFGGRGDGAIGYIYKPGVVLADECTSDRIRKDPSRLESLPDGVKIIHEIQVTRVGTGDEPIAEDVTDGRLSGRWEGQYNWNGTGWITGMEACLAQTGNQVTGKYTTGNKGGTIKGEINDNRLDYDYSGSDCTSNGYFIVSEDGAQMSGEYNCGSNKGIWKLNRIDNSDCDGPSESGGEDTTQCTSQEPSGTVTITFPMDGGEHAYGTDIYGSFSAVPEGVEIWGYSWAPLAERFWLFPIEKNGNTSGTWRNKKVGFGRRGTADIGYTYKLGVGLADECTSDGFRDNRSRLASIPEGIRVTDEISFKRVGTGNEPIAAGPEEDETVNCKGDLISDADPDNNVSIRFLSSLGSLGNELPKDASGVPQLNPSMLLRVGEPFLIELKFANDLECTSGEILLYSKYKDPKYSKRVKVKSYAGSKKIFRTRMLTPDIDSANGDGHFLIVPPKTNSTLLHAVSKIVTEMGSGASYSEIVSVMPPFEKGKGALSVYILDYNDRQMSEYTARKGGVSLICPDGTLDFRPPSNLYLEDNIETGTCTVRLDIMGARIEVPHVVIKERGKTEIKLGGSKEFGVIGYPIEAQLFLERVLDDAGEFQCQYARNGKVVNVGGCYAETLPKGTYEMILGPALFPVVASVTVQPGKFTTLDARMGVLVIHNDIKVADQNRNLVAKVKMKSKTSKDIPFVRKTTQVLPVGEYIVEVMEMGKSAKHQSVIQIHPAKATFFSVGETPSDSSSNVESQCEEPLFESKDLCKQCLDQGLKCKTVEWKKDRSGWCYGCAGKNEVMKCEEHGLFISCDICNEEQDCIPITKDGVSCYDCRKKSRERVDCQQIDKNDPSICPACVEGGGECNLESTAEDGSECYICKPKSNNEGCGKHNLYENCSPCLGQEVCVEVIKDNLNCKACRPQYAGLQCDAPLFEPQSLCKQCADHGLKCRTVHWKKDRSGWCYGCTQKHNVKKCYYDNLYNSCESCREGQYCVQIAKDGALCYECRNKRIKE